MKWWNNTECYVLGNIGKWSVVVVRVGFVMGGIQSVSRSTYSKFLPELKDTASYFSFFDVAEKIGIVLGLFIFALMLMATTWDVRSCVFLRHSSKTVLRVSPQCKIPWSSTSNTFQEFMISPAIFFFFFFFFYSPSLRFPPRHPQCLPHIQVQIKPALP